MNNLKRLYYQNKRGVWWIILSIAFFIIILQMINYFVSKSEDKKLTNSNIVLNADTDIVNDKKTTLTTGKSITEGTKLSADKLNEEAGTIRTFFSYCSNGNLENAYNMLTDECKEELYSDIDQFKRFYYADIYEDVRVSFEIENWANSTYKISVIPDMLATGKSNNGTVKQDYITVVKVNEEYKLNISNYIGRSQINKTQEQNGVSITVNYKDTYMEYEQYNITAKNNRTGFIILDDLKSSNTMYLQDKNDMQYPSYSHEILRELLRLEPRVERNLEIKYYSRYTTAKTINKIVFSQVVVDYGKHENSTAEGIEKIEINL